MSVNYLIEINALDDWELTHPLNPTAYKVMRKLLYLANKERFPERMNVPNTVLMSIVGCSEDSLAKARNQLIQAGLIAYKGQKKITPLYAIRYFSHNPTYNPKLRGYEQGIAQGMEQGYKQGIPQGIEQGTYIHKTLGNEGNQNQFGTDEEISAAGIGGAGARQINFDENRLDEILPPRTQPITRFEQMELDAFWVYAQQPDVAELIDNRKAVVERILASDRFPLALVSEALFRTVKRNRNYPLDNPVAYLLTLLFDWEDRKIMTVNQLRASQDDWRGEA